MINPHFIKKEMENSLWQEITVSNFGTQTLFVETKKKVSIENIHQPHLTSHYLNIQYM